MIRVRHIFISPGHNFFGHYGKPAGEHPAIEVPQVRCVTGRGLEGDRFFDFKPGYKGQVTFFAWEEYQRLSALFQVSEKSPAVFRRNIITEGVDLNALMGEEFEVQGVRFRGMAECSPCEWMDAAFHPGAKDALLDRGGLRARVLSDGVIKAVSPTPPAPSAASAPPPPRSAPSV